MGYLPAYSHDSTAILLYHLTIPPPLRHQQFLVKMAPCFGNKWNSKALFRDHHWHLASAVIKNISKYKPYTMEEISVTCPCCICVCVCIEMTLVVIFLSRYRVETSDFYNLDKYIVKTYDYFITTVQQDFTFISSGCTKQTLDDAYCNIGVIHIKHLPSKQKEMHDITRDGTHIEVNKKDIVEFHQRTCVSAHFATVIRPNIWNFTVVLGPPLTHSHTHTPFKIKWNVSNWALCR